jgi:aryl-alcohol dehydrogenase-like predicted oxidoreductase
VTFLDSSDLYGSGHNEELVGRAIAGRRERTRIATKFGIVREGGRRRIDNSPEWIRSACEASLRRLVERAREIAKEAGCTPARLALAWLLHQGDDVVPIPGTKRVSYLDENAAAVDIELGDEQLRALDELFPPGAAAGDRYTPEGTASVER